MLPAFLITLREVIEATIIVATILGILVKFNLKTEVKTVWLAVIAASVTSCMLIGVGSLLGLEIHKLFTGTAEQLFEGILMIISVVFITVTVFFLHNFLSRFKDKLIKKISSSAEQHEQKGLFILIFVAIFREGFEIVLFLSTIYLSANPQQVIAGFAGGIAVGLLVAFTLFMTTSQLPSQYAMKVCNLLLIVFGAGLLARAIHEFVEAGFLPELASITLPLIPKAGTFLADILKSVLGITQQMDVLQLVIYALYCGVMWWYMWGRKIKMTS